MSRIESILRNVSRGERDGRGKIGERPTIRSAPRQEICDVALHRRIPVTLMPRRKIRPMSI
jgi:hypothetical protein